MGAGIAVCADLEALGFDPGAMSSALRRGGLLAEVVPGPCRHAGSVDGWDRTVFAVCPDGPSGDELRTRARRDGADPAVGAASVDVVSVASYGPVEGRDERALAVLAARLGGLAAAPPSPSDGFRVGLPGGRVSRRSLLSFGVRYVPVATVGKGGCRGSAACGLCVEACPVDVIDRRGRVPRVDVTACIGCGACVTACPVEGAALLPSADLGRFETELAALAGRGDPTGIVLGCAGAPPLPDGRLAGAWLPVEVPCMSIVTPSWALSALAAGSRSVTFRGCGGACAAGAAEPMRSIVAFAQESLSFAGIEDARERVRLLLPEEDAFPPGPDPAHLSPLGDPSFALRLREPAGSANALSALGAVSGSIAGPGSPFGRVTLDAEGCSMCGLCAGVCPTGAIRFEQGAVVASLDLDRSSCLGCGHCAAICPESVLAVERGVDLEDLGEPPQTLKRSPVALCRRCGDPVAPTAMLERLRPMLEPAMVATIEGLCQRCRGVG